MSPRQRLVRLAFAALGYGALIRLGLALTAFKADLSAFWPASGLAVALCFRWGSWIAPAIWIAAAVGAILPGEPLFPSVLVATVNTVLPLAAAALLRRLEFRADLERTEDVLAFGLVGLLLPALTGLAGAGAFSLCMAGATSTYGDIFRLWWVSDALGILAVAPLFFTLRLPIRLPRGRRLVEALALGAAVLGVSLAIFGSEPDTLWGAYANAFVPFPVLIWAAMRFGPSGAAAASLATDLIAFLGTAEGLGPFAGQEVKHGEFGLGLFLALGTTSIQLLAAVNIAKVRAAEGLASAQAKLALAERMASLGTLAAGVAHEINNPLASVMANLHFVSDSIGVGEGQVREALAESLEGADRIRRIVDDLRSFAKDGKSGGAAVDPAAAVDLAVRMASSTLRQQAELIERREPMPQVYADPGRLGQVVVNLLVNAAQAIPPAAEDRRIELRTGATDDGWALIEVSDRGVGIPPENLPRIFEPFFTTRDVGVGMGLGLSICHQIVTDQGGEIRVESRMGSGTTVRVTLPPAGKGPGRAAA